jgi:hypothetical protein
MRKLLFALVAGALALAGCEESTITVSGAEAPVAEGSAESYTLEVFVSDGDQVYLMTDAGDGAMAAARVSAGVSSFLDPSEARALLSQRQSAMSQPTQEQVAVTLPGFSVRVNADPAAAEGGGENAHVSVNLGGQQFEVNTAGQGETGQVQTRIGGLSAEAARAIIVDLDELEPGVQQQMLDELGL